MYTSLAWLLVGSSYYFDSAARSAKVNAKWELTWAPMDDILSMKALPQQVALIHLSYKKEKKEKEKKEMAKQ